MKRIVSVFLVIVLLFTFVPFSKTLGIDVCITASAAGEGVYAKLNSLRNKFPDGYFWNHKVTAYSNNGDQLFNNGDESFADSITGSPCATHNGVASVGQYDCNYFDGGIQCFGFAGKIFYDVFGQRKSGLQKVYNNNYGVSVGDYVRVNNDSHSAVVLTKSGDYITVVECNLSGDGNAALNCKIRWDATYPISSITYYCHATNYAQIDGSSANFYQSVTATNITETDAYIEASIVGTNLSTCGFYIGKSTDSMDKVTETVNGYVEKMYYNVQADYNALEPGTKYYYKFFLTVGGTEYCSDVYSFTTAGSSLVTGTCGDKLTWSFNETTGVLTISGTGDMRYFPYFSSAPWYEYRQSIKNITIGNGVTSIGENAFYGCTSLTSITIPNNVISIGSDAFFGCTSLTKITIADGVKDIGKYAFFNTGYYNDKSNWDENVLYIGKYLIYADKNITGSYKIREGVVCIASTALWDCTGLTSVTFPDSVTSIDLTCCTGLASVTIPSGVTSVILRDCTSLTSVTIPSSVTSIDLYGCTGLENIIVEASNTTYSSDEFGVLFNKDKTKIIKYPAGNQREKYTIPDSVTGIDSYAFYGCTGLTSVTITDSVTSIGSSAFYGCSGLTSVTIPDSVTSIGSRVFQGCTGLTSVTIPDSVTSIGSDAFYGCSGLTSVTIPDSITSIGSRVFQGCTGLTSVTIPDSITSIGYRAFLGCSGLTSITIPDSVTSIDDSAFSGCTGLKKIVVETSNTAYSSDEYGVLFNKDRTKLIQYPAGNPNKEYTIPGSVTGIDDSAFSGCTNLEKIVVEASNTAYSSDEYGVLFDKNKTRLLRCPAGNPSKEYTIPDSVESIYSHAFSGCTGLKNVIIHDSVTIVDIFAFSGCRELEEVYYVGTETQWEEIRIQDPNTELMNATIHYCEKVAETLPTSCLNVGYTEGLYCTKCEKYVHGHEVIPAEDHDYVLTEIPATCTTAGEKVYTCECGDSYSETVPALGHNPEYFKVEPTCTEEGYECYKCTNCGTEYSRETIPASGHSYEDEIITEPTCIGEGLKRCTCSACGDSYEETMPLAEHKITTIRKDPTCAAIGNEQYMCEVCKNMIGDMVILPKAPHSYGEWTITAPTATEAGSKDHSCMSCGKTETASIPATGFETAEGVAIDFATNTITGFKAGETSLNSYTVTVDDNSIWEYETLNGRLGTGSKAILKDGDTVIGEYTILIFGDVNGDSWYDGQDAVLASCLANGMLSKDDVSEAVYRAADCNHDGTIDQRDIVLLNQAGAMLTNIDQSEQVEVLFETSSEYVEYLNLIDQSASIESKDEPEINDEDTESEEAPETDEENTTQQGRVEINLFDMIIRFIKSVLDRMFSYIPGPLK